MVFSLAACGGPTGSGPAGTSGPTSGLASAQPTDGELETPATGCAAQPGGIVAWWRAEDDATDAIGTNDGQSQGGAGFAAGHVGQAFAFDGNAQFIEVADADDLQLAAGLTIEGWVFAAGAPAQYAGLAGTWDDNSGAHRTYLFWVFNQQLELIVSRDGGETPRATDVEPFPTDRWVHVAGTFDTDSIRLYRDGLEVASAPLEGEIAVNSLPFRIGRTEGGSVGSNYWRGSIDELSIYDRALGPDEIAAIQAADTDGKCTT
jgi:hypothetical protein